MPKRIKQSSQAQDEASAPEQDVEALRAELARKLVAFVNRKQWRGCPQRLCRRQHRCTADLICANPRPPRATTPQEQAASMAYLRRALQRRMAAMQGGAR